MFAIDVSEFQGQPNYASIRGAGVDGVIARVSYGPHHTDFEYAYNKVAIKAAGLHAGAYHYLVAGNDGARQAQFFAALADPDAAHFLDVEVPQVLDVPGFISEYRKLFPDKTLWIYTRKDVWKTCSPVQDFPECPLWVAQYPTFLPGTLTGLWALVGNHRGNVPFGGWSAPGIMQYSDRTRVPGIDGYVDADYVFNVPTEWIEAGVSTSPSLQQIEQGILYYPVTINGENINVLTCITRSYEILVKLEAALPAHAA